MFSSGCRPCLKNVTYLSSLLTTVTPMRTPQTAYFIRKRTIAFYALHAVWYISLPSSAQILGPLHIIPVSENAPHRYTFVLISVRSYERVGYPLAKNQVSRPLSRLPGFTTCTNPMIHHFRSPLPGASIFNISILSQPCSVSFIFLEAHPRGFLRVFSQ